MLAYLIILKDPLIILHTALVYYFELPQLFFISFIFYFHTIHSFLSIKTIELSEDVKGILLLLLAMALSLQPPLALLVIHPPLGRGTQHLQICSKRSGTKSHLISL